jgi:hypothetical protein
MHDRWDAVGRTIIVGDVHGCADELDALLARVRVAPGDSLVFVGDLVARGPDSRRVLATTRRLGARAVRGNHEHKLLAHRMDPRGVKLGAAHALVARELDDEDWRALEAAPLWVDLDEHAARVVHAGVVPGTPIARTPVEALLKMRTLDARGRWSDEPDAGALWGETYAGPPHVVFGHNARQEPQLHRWATGLDTGCVYGGALTAMVLDAGEPVPRGDAARAKLVSVPARKKYWGDKGAPLAR